MKWLKVELTMNENKKLMKEIENEDMVNYKSFNNLMKIHHQHINVRFDGDIWMIYGKQLPPGVTDSLNRNLDFLRDPLIKNITETNPLVNATYLEELLYQFKDEFSPQNIT